MCLSTPRVKTPEPANLQKAEQGAAMAQLDRLRSGSVRTMLTDRTGSANDAKPASLLRQMLGGS
jgi:hypothetical protein